MPEQRLLVLDDDDDVADTVALVARSHGFDVRTTATPDEFFGWVDAWAPTHVAVDLLMPAMDGLNFARRLQQEPEWRSIPIVAVTALGQLADYIMTWTHGFQAHLTKPVDPALLVNVVRKLVHGRAAAPGPPPAAPPPTA